MKFEEWTDKGGNPVFTVKLTAFQILEIIGYDDDHLVEMSESIFDALHEAKTK